MSTIYERVTTFKCLDVIYYQGLAFGEAGRSLIDSNESKLFVPGIINICLATELFLKSINATVANLEDEIKYPNGVTLYEGRNDDYFKISPSGQGHHLSKLYSNLPAASQTAIMNFAAEEGFYGDVAAGLQQYDKVFVDWRYIYEKKNPEALGTHPLFPLCNAIEAYCRSVVGQFESATSDPIGESHPSFGTAPK